MTKSNRYFCVVSIKSGTKEINLVRKLKSNNCIGRYKGSSPVIAAKKVASRVFREVKGVSRKVLEIKIHENTSKSKKKDYTYKLKKEVFKEPQGPFKSKFKIVVVPSKKK